MEAIVWKRDSHGGDITRWITARRFGLASGPIYLAENSKQYVIMQSSLKGMSVESPRYSATKLRYSSPILTLDVNLYFR